MTTNQGKSWDVEAVEESLNTLIERRAKEAGDANYAARAWTQSIEKYNLRAQAERRAAWIEYHNDLARLHGSLAKEHQEQARELAGEG